ESAVAWSEPTADQNSLSLRLTTIGHGTRELGRTSRMVRGLAATGNGSTLVVAAEGSLRGSRGRARGTEPGLGIASGPFDDFECVLNWSGHPGGLHVYGSVVLAAPSVPGQYVLAAVTAAGATAANVQGPARALAVSPDGTRVVYRTFGPTGSLMEQDIAPLRSE